MILLKVVKNVSNFFFFFCLFCEDYEALGKITAKPRL